MKRKARDPGDQGNIATIIPNQLTADVDKNRQNPAASGEASVSGDEQAKDISIRKHGGSSPQNVELASRGIPALPWMRVPLAIEGGAAVPLHAVRGLQPCIVSGMTDGETLVSARNISFAVRNNWLYIQFCCMVSGATPSLIRCISLSTFNGRSLAILYA